MKEGGKGYEEEEDRWSREGRVRHGMRGLLAEELLMEAKVSCFLLLLQLSLKRQAKLFLLLSSQ